MKLFKPTSDLLRDDIAYHTIGRISTYLHGKISQEIYVIVRQYGQYNLGYPIEERIKKDLKRLNTL